MNVIYFEITFKKLADSLDLKIRGIKSKIKNHPEMSGLHFNLLFLSFTFGFHLNL